MVPPGFSLPHFVVTNRPDDADRVTVREFEVPEPTRSVVVVRGDLFACAAVTNLPVRALLLTERAFLDMITFRSPAPGSLPVILEVHLSMVGFKACRIAASVLQHRDEHNFIDLEPTGALHLVAAMPSIHKM